MRQPASKLRAPGERGVTLVELMIALTLVAALSVGMLMAMRTGLLTLDKIDNRLQSNRRVVRVHEILAREIGGVLPAMGGCGSPIPSMIVFSGNESMLRLVSTYSLVEGARGVPQFLELQVAPLDRGAGVRLIVNEHPFAGPASTAAFCAGGVFQPAQVSPDSFILFDRLASVHFSYREHLPNSLAMGKWVPSWNRPDLPAAVRVDMTPLVPDPASLPLLSVTVPLHVTAITGFQYADVEQ